MITKNYSDLTTDEILRLAAIDSDSAELATRLARRLMLGVRLATGAVTEAEIDELHNLVQATDGDIEVPGTKGGPR